MFPEFFIPYEWIAAFAFVYFFPTYLAFALGHVDAKGVFFNNVCFGWTIVGWFIALIWALQPGSKS